MSIKTKELKKIEKGCGMEFDKLIRSKGIFREKKSLEWGYCKSEDLCPTCKARKTQTIELCKKFEDEVKEKVEKFNIEIESSVNVQKRFLKDNPESEFHIGRIQGLRTAEDIFDKIFGDEE